MKRKVTSIETYNAKLRSAHGIIRTHAPAWIANEQGEEHCMVCYQAAHDSVDLILQDIAFITTWRLGTEADLTRLTKRLDVLNLTPAAYESAVKRIAEGLRL